MGNSPKGEYMLKKENIMKLLGIGIMSLFLLGCAESSFLLTEKESPKMQEGQVLEDDQVALEEQVAEDEQTTLEEQVTEESQTVLEETQEIVVHICGAVNNSGVFFLEEGERVYHAIELAGGLKADADGDYSCE